MRQIRSVAGCLLGVLALSAVVAGSASAALPELGTCVAKPGGKFVNKLCTKPGFGKGAKFEFLPGATKKKFVATATPRKGIALTLETIAGTKVTCAAATISGEY